MTRMLGLMVTAAVLSAAILLQAQDVFGQAGRAGARGPTYAMPELLICRAQRRSDEECTVRLSSSVAHYVSLRVRRVSFVYRT